MKHLLLISLLASCTQAADAKQSVDLATCKLASNERECILGALDPGDCYDGVCFPYVTQWEAGEALAEPFCSASSDWWCAKEAVFTWCGGGAAEHCTEVVQDGVLLDQCMTNIAPGVLPDGCEELFK